MCSLLKLPGWADIKEVVLHHLDAEARLEAVLVCKEFYGTICHLERNKCLVLNQQLIDSMKNQNILDSIINSSRRIGELKIDTNCAVEDFERSFVVVQKFIKHIKKLTLTVLPYACSAETLAILMNAAIGVADLELTENIFDCDEFENHVSSPETMFTKLKRLSIFYIRDISAILNRIPDHSLEGLSVEGDEHSGELCQTFVDRQNKLKKLSVSIDRNLNVDHLALEELDLYDERDDKELTALLKYQPALRSLDCRTIGNAAFNELRKMRNLEVLRANVTEECTGELANLKELELYDYKSSDKIFRRVLLPKLETFSKKCGDSMEVENFMALSRSSQNLQQIEIVNSHVNFWPIIIELFPKLKKLLLQSYAEFGEDPNDEVLFGLAPSCQNLSMEEIVIKIYGPVPIGSLYEAINACPNLKRISLLGLRCTSQNVLGLIQSHPQLTHFAFNDPTRELFQRPGDDVDSVHPTLIQIITIFRASTYFKHLFFDNLANWGEQRIEDLLTDDAAQIIVRKLVYDNSKACTLKLVKKPKVRDPFENFDSDRY